jgi:hypothetical protein
VGNHGECGVAGLGFEQSVRCVLGLHWLQKPVDIMWPKLRAGDCRVEGLALRPSWGERMVSSPIRRTAYVRELYEVKSFYVSGGRSS